MAYKANGEVPPQLDHHAPRVLMATAVGCHSAIGCAAEQFSRFRFHEACARCATLRSDDVETLRPFQRLHAHRNWRRPDTR
jgi:hypothetical protein